MTEQRPADAAGSAGGLVITQRVAAPPEAVFEFLVVPEKMLRWMGVEADLEPTPGGTFRVDVNGSDVAVGTYVVVDPPHRVVFTWGWQGSTDVPPGSSTVTVTLVADGADTIVELRHDGLPGGSGDEHAEGWNHFLPLLAGAANG